VAGPEELAQVLVMAARVEQAESQAGAQQAGVRAFAAVELGGRLGQALETH
jgi:hypothetical protein